MWAITIRTVVLCVAPASSSEKVGVSKECRGLAGE